MTWEISDIADGYRQIHWRLTPDEFDQVGKYVDALYRSRSGIMVTVNEKDHTNGTAVYVFNLDHDNLAVREVAYALLAEVLDELTYSRCRTRWIEQHMQAGMPRLFEGLEVNA